MPDATPVSTPGLVSPSDPENESSIPKPGVALCLSGGGYRAMLFHVGSLWRMNELGLLPSLDCVSSVSGGSITAAVLGARWNELDFDGDGVARRFVDSLVTPLRNLANQTIDIGAVLGGLANPFSSIAKKVANAYRTHLFDKKQTLQDLPDRPIFVLNSTNIQSAVLWRFTKKYMGDYRVGYAPAPTVELAVAVGASSAFPPVLSPVTLSLRGHTFSKGQFSDLSEPPYTTTAILGDGGVYDNLGLAAAFNNYDTLLVSDAGAKTPPEPKPAKDWARHVYRVLDLIDNQVRSLRKRNLIDQYIAQLRKGVYWGIRTNILDYHLDDALNKACSYDHALFLAEQPTRLKRMVADLQERLINWGYAVADAGLRTHYKASLSGNLPAPSFPYPKRGV